MRTMLAVMGCVVSIQAAGCVNGVTDGTNEFTPQESHAPRSALAEFAQCLAQAGTPPDQVDAIIASISDGGFEPLATLPDGGFDPAYFTKQQCGAAYARFDAGTYTSQ